MGWGVHDYPAPPEPEPNPICPICGWECETYYFNTNNEIIGCDNCIASEDAYEWRLNNE